ncbi:MAG: type II toxin-antitoxin system RelE/ParE family toxin [Deltaproteobacteria bacterium]|nr:type II toxin-antitoxin system RelE/ParE family toxin [Deltaproteobacteria bacterium]
MNKQQIEYYNQKVEKSILRLPAGLLARFLRLTELIEEFGPNLGMPHTRALGDKLFELRLKSKEGIGRIFYCSKIGGRIIILHSFIKKTQKMPKKELEIAKKRLKEALKK